LTPVVSDEKKVYNIDTQLSTSQALVQFGQGGVGVAVGGACDRRARHGGLSKNDKGFF